MSRVFGIELRRSAARGTALVVLLLGLVLIFFAGGILFADGWMQLAMTQRWYLALLWPLALAAGGWQARREHRSRVAELFASTPRPRALRIVPTLGAMAVAVVAGYLAMGLLAGLWIAGTAEYLPAAAFGVAAVGCLALIAATWLGLAVGRLLPSPVTAPMLAIAGLAAVLFTPWATRPRGWLSLVFSPIDQMNMPDAYTTVPGRVSVAQACWMAGLAITAVLLLASGGRRLRVAAVLPVLAGAALAITVMPHHNRTVLDAVDPVARELMCTEDAPRVCVSRVHSGLLAEFTPRARAGLAALAKLPDAPAEVHEDTTVYPDDGRPAWRADVVLLDVVAAPNGHLGNESSAAEVVVRAFRGRATCENPSDPADDLAAASWLTGQAPVSPTPSTLLSAGTHDPETVAQATQRWQGLRKLPEDKALARVVALRQAAVTCSARDGIITGGTP
ncbi:hypothetical protein AB0M54_17845 [Actinoplanes sp. NPDC051470]|uniref:hypothetical protein n=1 Tax=Actinoplanes sp. NPDC051470 TaxID=3157224 RepID=UPI0034336375